MSWNNKFVNLKLLDIELLHFSIFNANLIEFKGKRCVEIKICHSTFYTFINHVSAETWFFYSYENLPRWKNTFSCEKVTFYVSLKAVSLNIQFHTFFLLLLRVWVVLITESATQTKNNEYYLKF